jgi:hypothetical protein
MPPALEGYIRADVTFSVLSIALLVTHITFSTKGLIISNNGKNTACPRKNVGVLIIFIYMA